MRKTASEHVRLGFPAGVIAILVLGWSAFAQAQVAGGLSLQSDYEVRGKSLTQDRPVAIADLSYDLSSGIYLNGSAFGALPSGGHPGLVGAIGDLGYARRLNLSLSMDVGVMRSQYTGVGQNGYSTGYTEVYTGLSTRHFSGRIYYSPDYFKPGAQAFYAELDGNVGLVAGVRLNAHVGSLTYLNGPTGLPAAHTEYDWLVGASRQFGPVNLHAGVFGGGPDQPYDYHEPQSRTRVLVGAAYTF